MGGPGPGGTTSDRELVLAFQAGVPSAYEEMFRRHHERVLRVCSRMLQNPQDAEEATQETFLKAYQALPRFNGQFQLGAWLAKIATNVCVDHLRVRARSHLVALPQHGELLEAEASPEDVVVGEHPRLDEAIKYIQPLHARALALRAVEGLSHREIAGRLHITPPQAKALLHRARTSLRRAWDQAQGWVAAPVLSIRSLFGRENASHASQAGSNIVVVSPQVPFLMEKVAASAVIVVVALTGLPLVSAPTDNPYRPGTGGRGSGVLSAAAPAIMGSDATVVAPDGGAGEALEPSPLEDLSKTLEAAVPDRDRVPGHGSKDNANDDGDGVDDQLPGSVKSTTRRGKEIAKELAEDVGIVP